MGRCSRPRSSSTTCSTRRSSSSTPGSARRRHGCSSSGSSSSRSWSSGSGSGRCTTTHERSSHPGSAEPIRTEPPPPKRRWLPFNRWHLLLFPLLIVMLFPLVWMLIDLYRAPARGASVPAGPDPVGIPLAELSERAGSGPVRPVLHQLHDRRHHRRGREPRLLQPRGYAFARINFAGKNVIFILLLATLMVPFQVTMIPAFLIVKWLRACSTTSERSSCRPRPGLRDLHAPQFFRTLPVELEEAARIDGASRLGVLFKIILPLSLPALSTLAALMFLFSWNDFLWPLIVSNATASDGPARPRLLPRRTRHAMDAPHGRERA